MAFKLIGTTSGVEVDTDTDKSLRITNRPPAFGSLGCYSIGQATGLIAATGSANAVIWTCRWTDGTRFAIIRRVRVNAVVTGTITTAVPYDLELFFCSSYTVSPTTSITAATITGRNQKLRTSMGTTLMGGLWVLTTAAAGITGQTLTADSQSLGRVSGASGTVIGTQFFGSQVILWDAEAGHHPIVLAANEGLTIKPPRGASHWHLPRGGVGRLAGSRGVLGMLLAIQNERRVQVSWIEFNVNVPPEAAIGPLVGSIMRMGIGR